MPEPISIRRATAADMPAVHALVCELAAYEREPEAVTASAADYARDFAAGLFDCLVAEAGGELLGMVLFFTAYSSWKGKMMYLDDFVVRQDRRQQGIGQMLYDALLAQARAQGAKLLKWQVLDWNAPAVAFYEKNGAAIERNWWNAKVFLQG